MPNKLEDEQDLAIKIITHGEKMFLKNGLTVPKLPALQEISANVCLYLK